MGCKEVGGGWHGRDLAPSEQSNQEQKRHSQGQQEQRAAMTLAELASHGVGTS